MSVTRTISPRLQKSGASCAECGTPYDRCTERLLSRFRACCSGCTLTDTHDEHPAVSRPTRDQNFLDMAEVASRMSTCSRLQVGAVLVRDKRIIGTGYNGAPPGLPHCVHTNDTPCTTAVHAESNALMFATGPLDGATMYCTHAPCLSCSLMIITKRVVEVVYKIEYRNRAGIEQLRDAGLIVRDTI